IGDEGHRREAADDPAADLGPARIIDNREPASADAGEEPLPGSGIPRLARASQDAERGEIMRTRRALEEYDRRTQPERSQDEEGPHHPAHVGVPQHPIAGTYVHAEVLIDHVL